jgi:hypothetical protein
MEYLSSMRWTNKIFIVLGAAFVSSSSLQAVPAANLKENYQTIIERNPFGLKDPPPPPTNNPAPPKEKPKVQVYLTGLTAVDFPRLPKQAYFYTVDPTKKDPPVYYALNEGDSKDGIQVLNIDAQKRKVRVKMEDKETVLSFETHGVASPGGGKTMPGVPNIPAPGQPFPQPGGPSNLPGPANPPPPGQAMYDANGQPVYNPAAQPQALSQPNTVVPNTGLRQIPSRRVRREPAMSGGTPPPMGGAGGAGAAVQQPQGPVDVAEDYLRMHLNRAAREREGIPMPPVPTFE